MADFTQYSPISGEFVGKDGKRYNIVDLLNPEGKVEAVSEACVDVSQYDVHGAGVVGSDGKVYDLVKLLENAGGGGGGSDSIRTPRKLTL